MSTLTQYGPVKASCKQGDKMVWIPVGYAFKDTEGRLVIRLDSTPLPHQNWNGFLNIYEAD